nr:sensor histidine kinase [Novosphingobium taihuense]
MLAVMVGPASIGQTLPAGSSSPRDAAGSGALHGFKLRHWSLEEGAPSRINAITQSRDGFLWIGGVDGLVRFDGITFERIGPPPTSPNRIVVARLLSARDGAVWIGLARRKGVMVWRNGRLEDAQMPNPSREVNDIAQGPDGAIWVTRGGRGTLSLARFANGRWTEFDTSSGLPAEPAWNPLFARDGTLWLTTESGVYRRNLGASRFETTGIVTVPRATLAEAADGTIWLTEKSRTRPIAKGATILPAQSGFATPFAIRTLFDRHGAFWGATWSDGAFRVDHLAPGKTAQMLRLDTGNGLLSDPVRALFEDREGNIWIGGEMGLNMLRRVPIAQAAGIPADPATNHMLAVDRSGEVYVADDHALFRIPLNGDPVRVGMPTRLIEAICAANSGGIWVIERGSAVHVREARVIRRFAMPTSFAANSCGEDEQGRLWLPSLQRGLWLLQRGTAMAYPQIDGAKAIPGNVAVQENGRAAIHFRGKPPHLKDSPFDVLADGDVPSGGIDGLLPLGDALYTSGNLGLAAPMRPGTPLLSATRYPWASSLNGMVQTQSGDIWAIGDAGLVRLKSSALRHAIAHPGAEVAYRQFDFRDGLASFAQKSAGAQIVAGGDGRIWFATRSNVSSIDPRMILTNDRPPDVIVRGFRTGPGTFYSQGARLPAGTTRVEVDYTATSLSVPERVRFRYRLDRDGAGWISSGLRTAAFDGLGPGRYRFELLAANEDGVWSSQPAVAEFTIASAFHQTWWFRIAVVLAAGAMLYGIYEMRLRQVSARIRSRMAARNSERERIARELHDTMIQGVQGLILRFQAVADRFAHDPEAQAVLQPALERAEEMLVEGRERVTGLRNERTRNLHRELNRLMKNEIYPAGLIAPLVVQRTPRPISESMIDDLLSVIGEALNNAACHSGASRVDVGVRYGRWEFSAYVRDNGIGISNDMLAKGSPKGHFGLLGMRERMFSIGGKLSIESAEGFGTTIRMTLPAKIAYKPKQSRLMQRAMALWRAVRGN